MWGARGKRSAGGLLIALALLLTGCGIETSSPRIAGRVASTTDPGAAASSDASTVPSAEPSATETVTPSSTQSTPAGTPPAPAPALVSKPVKPTPVVVTKNVVVVRSVAFKKKNVRDPERPQGENAVTTRGMKGKKQLTYAVTYTDGKETGRRLVREVVTVAPVTQITSI
ncbi:MAG: resuscitation-promoting factor RpfB, partial [Kribbellaceae bacterium]|nr:resuscitation-promoting factor RpfB [Kribbellaceae bacterium]